MTEENPLTELEHEPTETVLEGQEVEGQEGEVSPEEQVEKAAQEKAAKKQRYSDRVKDLNTKFREEERAGKAKDRRIAELEDAAKIKSKPVAGDYEDHDKYLADDKKYSEQEINDRVNVRFEEKQAESRRDEANKQINKQTEVYVSNRQKAISEDSKYIEYEKIVDNVNKDAPEIFNAILKGGGPAMVKYLGQNPDELEDIVLTDPSERMFELGKIAAKVKAKSPKTTSTAPDPNNIGKGRRTKSYNITKCRT